MADSTSKDAACPEPGLLHFFSARWRGETSLALLFWRDIIVVGTVLNLATSFGAVMALGFKAPAWVAILIHVSTLPYSVFLVAALWRTVDMSRKRASLSTAKTAALAWLACMAIV